MAFDPDKDLSDPEEAVEESDENALSPEDIENILEASGEDIETKEPERDPEAATADQLDVLQGMMGNFDTPPSESNGATEGPGEDENSEAQESSLEESPIDPEAATADQLGVLEGMVGNFENEPEKAPDSDDNETPSAEESNTEKADENPAPIEEQPEPESSSKDPEEATADEVDALKDLMGNFGGPSTSAEATEEDDDAHDEEEADETSEAAPSSPSPELLDPETIENLVGDTSPEAESSDEDKDHGEFILTEEILTKIITEIPEKPENADEEKPQDAADEVSDFLGDTEVEAVEDSEELSSDEISKLLDEESPEEEKEARIAAEEKASDEKANEPEDDLEEQELLDEEPEAQVIEAEQPELTTESTPEVVEETDTARRKLTLPSLSKKQWIITGSLAATVPIAFVSLMALALQFAKPSSKAPDISEGIPIVGLVETLAQNDIEPSIQSAIAPYTDRFDITTGWIHAVAHSGTELTATVPITAILKETLYEIVSENVIHPRLVLNPQTFGQIAKELSQSKDETIQQAPTPPDSNFVYPRFPEGYPTRATLTLHGLKEKGQWHFTEPAWHFAGNLETLPRGFSAKNLGSKVTLVDGPEVGAWVERYNQSASELLGTYQNKYLTGAVSSLRDRVQARADLFRDFETLAGRFFTADNLESGSAFTTVITDTYEDGFFEGYFQLPELGNAPKRFSGRVNVASNPQGGLAQTVSIQTYRQSGLETSAGVPSIFIEGQSHTIQLIREPGYLSGNVGDIYMTLAKP